MTSVSLSLTVVALAAHVQLGHAICTSDLDCSLNGVCVSGSCVCDKPWKGDVCGVLGYKVNPVSAKDLYPYNNSGPPVQPTTSLNTWNGPIIGPVDGKYHLFNPIYAEGSLLKSSEIMHGVADNITGPYDWTKYPNIPGSSNPAAVTFNDTDGKTKYTLWTKGSVLIAEDIAGPWTEIPNSNGYGGNPAPVYHNGVWYLTDQPTIQIFTTPKLGQPWTKMADVNISELPKHHREDPFMWVDKRGNWHIINHCFDLTQFDNCGSSSVSDHLFSPDLKNWHRLSPRVEPYTHTVKYEDGTSHTYTTLERPNLHFDSTGQLTHINLAADMITQDAGCANYTQCPAKINGQCACTNCKYADHAGTIIIALDV